MGRVIPLASAYGVEMDNLSTAYAELTKGGIATAEATTYLKSMLTELGSESSQVSGILQEVTGMNFAELTASGASLGDVMQILGDSVDGNATAFANLWGSQEAGVSALALYNAGAEQFNDTLSKMQSSAGATEEAFNTMESTTQDALDDLSNAFSNFGIAIGDAFAPLVEIIAGALTDFLNWLAEAASVCPPLTTAIIAVGAAFGVLQVAIHAFNLSIAATPIGIILAIVGGITALVTAIATWGDGIDEETRKYNQATPSVKNYADALKDLEDQYAAVEAAGGDNADQLAELAGQIAVASTEYETFYQSMEEFTNHLDDTESSVQNFGDKMRDTMQSMKEQPAIAQAYISKLQELGSQSSQSAGDMALMEEMVSRLNDMYPGLNASVDDFTNATEDSAQAMQDFVKQADEYSKMQAYMDLYEESVRNVAQAEIDKKMAQDEAYAAQERYNEAYKRGEWIAGYRNDVEDTTAALEQANATYDAAVQQQQYLEDAIEETGKTIGEMSEQTEDATAAAEEMFLALDEDAQAAIIAGEAYMQCKDQIDQIAQAHDEAAQAIAASLDSQINSFSAFAADTSATLATANENIRAGIDATNAYAENLETAKDYLMNNMHYTEEATSQIMSDMSDGSEKALGLAQSFADATREAVAGSREADQLISEYSTGMLEKVSTVEEAGQRVTDATGTWSTQLDEAQGNMEEIITGIVEQVDGISDQVAEKAGDIIDGLVQPIKDADQPMTEAANTAGTNAANAVAEAVATAYDPTAANMDAIVSMIESKASSAKPVVTVQVEVDTSTYDSVIGSLTQSVTKTVNVTAAGNAKGTRFSTDDIYIAGEEGPELIVGGYGSRVYNNEESMQIFDALRDVGAGAQSGIAFDYSSPFDVLSSLDKISNQPSIPAPTLTTPPPSSFAPATYAGQSGDVSESHSTLSIDLNGNGSISIPSGISKEEAADLITSMLSRDLKGYILSMLRQEATEEGERSYAF